MARVTVVLDEDEYAYLCDVAKANDLTVSQAARGVIQEYILYDLVGVFVGSDQADSQATLS